MKVDINDKGILIVSAETPLESYALHRWCEDNSKAFEGSKFTVEFGLQSTIESKDNEPA